MKRKIEDYIEMADNIRHDMWAMSDEAWNNGTPVPDAFYDLQNDLLKCIKNARAFCRRHGLECPYEIL